ncbi:MAG: hypothetical protein AAF928_13830 [Myxococcota bacterium]
MNHDAARRHRRGVVLLGVAVGLLGTGCGDASDTTPDGSAAPAGTAAPSTTTVCAPGEVPLMVDRALLAFLSKAKAVHRRADVAEDTGDRATALAGLDALVAGPRPVGEPPSPEVREVLADTLARTAALRSEGGDHAGAERDLARGLSLVPERNLFRGRLMEVTGVVAQRRYEALLAAGDTEAARAAKKEAITAFDEAVAIQDEVIRATLK